MEHISMEKIIVFLVMIGAVLYIIRNLRAAFTKSACSSCSSGCKGRPESLQEITRCSSGKCGQK